MVTHTQADLDAAFADLAYLLGESLSMDFDEIRPKPRFPPRNGAQNWQPSSPTKYGSRPLPVNSHLL